MDPGGETMVRSRVMWSVVAGLMVMLVLLYWRGFFWQHAALIGIGVLALVYSGLGTLERLKNLHRGP